MLQTKTTKSISQNQLLIKNGFNQTTIQLGAYEIESLDDEYKKIIFEESHFTDVNYTSTIQPNFSTVGSPSEIFRQEPLFSFLIQATFHHLTIFFSNVTSLKERFSKVKDPR